MLYRTVHTIMQYRTLGSGYTGTHQYCTAGLYGTRFSARNPIPLPSTRQYLYTLHAQALPSFFPFAFIDPFKFNFSLIYCLSSFFVQIFPFSLPSFSCVSRSQVFFPKNTPLFCDESKILAPLRRSYQDPSLVTTIPLPAKNYRHRMS